MTMYKIQKDGIGVIGNIYEHPELEVSDV